MASALSLEGTNVRLEMRLRKESVSAAEALVVLQVALVMGLSWARVEDADLGLATLCARWSSWS